MINNLKISGFKSLDNISIDFGCITLLVGKNSSGKSSIIQSILLAIQSQAKLSQDPLNGPLIAVGNFNEVSNIYINAKEISFEFNSTAKMKILEDSPNIFHKTNFSTELDDYLSTNNIKYLSSNRTGAQDIYLNSFEHNSDTDVLGKYSIQYFQKHKSSPLKNENLIYDKTQGATLDSQVNYWLNKIIGTNIRTESIDQADINIAKYKIKQSIQYVRPKNTGSGTSFIISILIKVLASKPNDTIIIENPEIHLHPKAQSKIIEFLIFASKNGVNIIIETHSDHIFNGLRKSIKNKELTPSDIKVYFTELTTTGTTANLVEFNDKGKVISKFEGLFDQFNLDLNAILGL